MLFKTLNNVFLNNKSLNIFFNSVLKNLRSQKTIENHTVVFVLGRATCVDENVIIHECYCNVNFMDIIHESYQLTIKTY